MMLPRRRLLPGDSILQRHHHDAKQRLVMVAEDSEGVVQVICPDHGICKVHSWSHDLIADATDESRAQAEREWNIYDITES